LVLSRTFDAPRRLVFEAWTKAEHVARWFTPRPLTTSQCEVDFRPRGAFRIVMRMPDGTEHPFHGAFGEISPPERLTFDGKLPDGNEVRTVVTFAEEDGKTTLTVRQTYSFESDATRGAPAGWSSTLDQLAEHVRRATRGKLRVHCFGVSVDGFGAGANQSLENPLGVGGMALHDWVFPTRTFQRMHGDGDGDGTTGIDDDFAARGLDGIGAWILGRNMFGPIRGPWGDETWKGWWGETPPYHTPVFVLTHHARPSLAMNGGTTFHFVTAGIHEALQRARDAAGGRDVRLGGGVATIREYLQARLVDEMHLAIAPVLLGAGEGLLAGIDLRRLGYRCSEHIAAPKAMHVVLTRDAAA
jgi:uncharacterized protein YndB with AHSA1/START domain/dihydrofolate reductase